MAIREQTGTSIVPESDAHPDPMSRRSILRGAAAAGAAGLAVSALGVPALARPRRASRGHSAGAAANSAAEAPDGGEAVVVHVRDARSGEMDVYRGTSHTRVTDRDLAARLARVTQ